MKILIPVILSCLSLSLFAQNSGVQKGTVDIREYVQGSKSFQLHDLFRFRDAERVVHAAELVFDRVYAPSSAELFLNNVKVASIPKINPSNRETRQKLSLPFRVVAGNDLKAELRMKGDLALRQVVLRQSGVGTVTGTGSLAGNREPLPGYGTRGTLPGYTRPDDTRAPGTITPVPTRPATPKPPVVRTVTNCTDRLFTTKGTRWATRSGTSFLESPQKADVKGKGAVDGWDFPELSGSIDGRDAVLQPGYKNALSLFPDPIFNEKFTRLKDLRLELIGEGMANVSLALAPFRDGPARTVRLSRTGTVLDIRGMNLKKEDLKHLEVTFRSNNGLRLDGMRAVATLETCTVKQVNVPSSATPRPTNRAPVKDIYLRGGNTKKK